MYTGDVWGITLIALGLIAATTAFQVLVSAVFGTRVGAASRCVARSPFASIGTGLLVLVAGVVAVVASGKVPGIGPGAAVLALIPLVLFALFGWTAASRVIGERLPSPADTAWRATMRGAVASGLFGIVVPVLGWFLVLPLVLAAGTGGLVLSFLRTPLEHEAQAAAA